MNYEFLMQVCHGVSVFKGWKRQQQFNYIHLILNLILIPFPTLAMNPRRLRLLLIFSDKSLFRFTELAY